MSDTEAAWLGAMIDAEGYIVANHVHYNHKVGVTNTEVEFMSACLRATGVGCVVFAPKSGRNKPMWEWVINRRYTALIVLERILPWSLKAQQWIDEFRECDYPRFPRSKVRVV